MTHYSISFNIYILYLLDDVKKETFHNFTNKGLNHTNFHVIQSLKFID